LITVPNDYLWAGGIRIPNSVVATVAELVMCPCHRYCHQYT